MEIIIIFIVSITIGYLFSKIVRKNILNKGLKSSTASSSILIMEQKQKDINQFRQYEREMINYMIEKLYNEYKTTMLFIENTPKSLYNTTGKDIEDTTTEYSEYINQCNAFKIMLVLTKQEYTIRNNNLISDMHFKIQMPFSTGELEKKFINKYNL